MYRFNKKNINFWVYIYSVIGAVWISALLITADFDSPVFAQQNQKEDFKPNVFNISGKPIGGIDEDGNIFNRSGKPVGSVDANGTVYNLAKKTVGKVDAQGKVFSQHGILVGSVDKEGRVFNRSGRFVGSVDAHGNTTLIGGAARRLLLKP